MKYWKAPPLPKKKMKYWNIQLLSKYFMEMYGFYVASNKHFVSVCAFPFVYGFQLVGCVLSPKSTFVTWNQMFRLGMGMEQQEWWTTPVLLFGFLLKGIKCVLFYSILIHVCCVESNVLMKINKEIKQTITDSWLPGITITTAIGANVNSCL